MNEDMWIFQRVADRGTNVVQTVEVALRTSQEIKSLTVFKGSRSAAGAYPERMYGFDERDGSCWCFFGEKERYYKKGYVDDGDPDVSETFNSLWDFYRAIGWNHKSRKFEGNLLEMPPEPSIRN